VWGFLPAANGFRFSMFREVVMSTYSANYFKDLQGLEVEYFSSSNRGMMRRGIVTEVDETYVRIGVNVIRYNDILEANPV
jgi:hypothetical protein